jgi:preprotein translocase subunit Sec63
MANDDRVIARAYRILGLEPGVSPLAAKRRFRVLVKESHPDRYPPDSPSQAEATRRTQEINSAYRMIKDAAVHHEVPLRQSTGASQAVSPGIASLEFDTITDRAIAAIVGLILGGFIDLAFMSDSALVWIAVPLIAAVAGAAFGGRAIELLIRLLWWIA